MSNKKDPQTPHKSGNLLSRLVKPFGGLLVILAFWFGSGAVGQFLQPWRYAGAAECIVTDYNQGAYRNGCDRDINIGWCVDGPPVDGNACVSETVAPAAVSQSWIGKLPAGKGRPDWKHACNTPYLPAWINDPNKAARKINGCRRAADVEAAAG